MKRKKRNSRTTQPKLWTTKPAAILSMYGPTTLHSVQYQQQGRFSKRCSLPCTTETLAAATNYAQPPTEKKISQTAQDKYAPRNIMARHLFERGIVAEFLVKGLVRGTDGSLAFAEKGSVSKEEIDDISKSKQSFAIVALWPLFSLFYTSFNATYLEHNLFLSMLQFPFPLFFRDCLFSSLFNLLHRPHYPFLSPLILHP